MTPVTPDQSIRGLEPTWSIVPAPPLGPSNMRCVQGSPEERPNVAGPILICIFFFSSQSFSITLISLYLVALFMKQVTLVNLDAIGTLFLGDHKLRQLHNFA